MKKLLFVGNSHLGAIKQGLKLGLDNSSIDEEKYLFNFAATIGNSGITCDSKYIFIDPEIDKYETYFGALNTTYQPNTQLKLQFMIFQRAIFHPVQLVKIILCHSQILHRQQIFK